MNASDLIARFATVIELPVDVNDVLDVLKANGCEDDIEFIGVDLDPDILQGKISIFWRQNGVYDPDPIRCANIYYHRGHTLDWQRMICCKELVHVLDPAFAHTSTIGDIDKLAEKIGLPPEMQDPMNDGTAVNVDRLAEWRAAALLLPLAARNAFMPAYKADKISTSEIALIADMPHRYVPLVMSDVWERLHDMLVAEAS